MDDSDDAQSEDEDRRGHADKETRQSAGNLRLPTASVLVGENNYKIVTTWKQLKKWVPLYDEYHFTVFLRCVIVFYKLFTISSSFFIFKSFPHFFCCFPKYFKHFLQLYHR